MIKAPSFLYNSRNLFVFFFVIYTIIAFLPKPQGMTQTNGDEPHYLVMTYNLIHQGNLEHLEKVYAKKVFKPWYGADRLEGHLIALPSVKNKVYAYHQIGLSILLIPGFYFAGLSGVLVTLTFIVSLGVVCMYKTLQYYLDKDLSLLTTLLVGLSLPLGVFANLIYPETVLLAFTTFLMMIILHKNFRLSLTNIILISCILVYLPIFHIKFVTLSILFLMYINILMGKKELKRVLIVDVLFVIGFVSYYMWLNSYYDGKFSEALSGISAGTTLSLLEIPSGLLGILVDRENGILIYSPYYIYIVYSIIPVIKKSLSEKFIKACHTLFPLFLTTGFTGFFTMFPYVMGGANPSGRYNLPVICAMAILVGIGFQTQKKFKFQRNVMIALSIYSIALFGLLSYNPLLGMPGNMENKVFFYLFQGNAHQLINVWLPNLSKYYRVIPLLDYVKGVGVLGAFIVLTSWGTKISNFFGENNKLWAFRTGRNPIKKSK